MSYPQVVGVAFYPGGLKKIIVQFLEGEPWQEITPEKASELACAYWKYPDGRVFLQALLDAANGTGPYDLKGGKK